MSRTRDTLNGGHAPPAHHGNGDMIASATREARTWHMLHEQRCLQYADERQLRLQAQAELSVAQQEVRKEKLRRLVAEGDAAAMASHNINLACQLEDCARDLIFAARHLLARPEEMPASTYPQQYPREAAVALLGWRLAQDADHHIPSVLADHVLALFTLLGFAGKLREAVAYKQASRDVDMARLVADGREAAEVALASCG